MKLQTTKKAINNNFSKIIKVGYCDLQNLLEYSTPFAYSAGVYGWACDYYEISNVCISTGYQPIGESVNYELIREYEAKAEKIRYNNSLDHSEREAQISELLNDFIKKAIN